MSDIGVFKAWGRLPAGFGRLALALALAAGLALGCASAEEKREAFLAKGRQLLEAQQYSEARFAARNALKVDPKFAKGYALVGQIAMAESKWQEAYAAFSQAASLDESLPEANAGLAKLFVMSGQHEEAEKHIGRLLAADPQGPEGLTIKAALHASRREFEPAQAILEPLVDRNPKAVDAVLLLAGIHRESKAPAKASAVLLKALAAAPESSMLLLRTASLLAEQGDFGQAEALLLRHDELAKANPQARMVLVSFYMQSRQPQKAEEHLRRLVAENPAEPLYITALARFCEEQGRPDDALRTIREGVARNPKALDLQLALGEVLLRRGLFAEGQETFEAVARVDGQGPKAVAAKRFIARIQAHQGRYDQALATLAWVMEKNPNDPDAHLVKGLIYLTQGKPESAVTEFRGILKDQPRAKEIYPLLARSHFKNREGQLGVEALQRALEIDPDYRPAKLMLVDYYQRQDQWDKALTELNSLQGKAGESQLEFARADLYFRWGRFDEAKRRYEGLARDPAMAPAAEERLGRLAMVDRNPRLAAEHFQKARGFDPANPAALVGRVEALLALNQPDQAMAALGDALAKDASPLVRELAGRVEMERGQLVKAEEHFKQALTQDPGRASSYQLLGLVYKRQGRTREAIAQLEESVKAKPDDIRAAFLLGLLHHQQDDVADAERLYQQVLTHQPGFQLASSYLAYLYAEKTSDQVKLQRAVELIRGPADAEDPGALHALGWVYQRLGNLELAEDALMQAAALSPYNPVVAYHAATVLQQAGKKRLARTILERGLAGGEQFAERPQALELLKKLAGS